MVVWAFLPPTDVWSTIWTPIIIDPETSQACPPNLPQTVHKTCFSYQVVWGRVVDKVTASSPSPWRSYVYVWWHKKTHEQVWTCAEHAWKVRERIGHIQETSRRHVGVMWETCRNMLETIWEPYLTHTRTYKKLFNIVGKSRDCKSMVYSPSVQGHSFKSEFLVVHSWFMRWCVCVCVPRICVGFPNHGDLMSCPYGQFSTFPVHLMSRNLVMLKYAQNLIVVDLFFHFFLKF